MCFPSDRGIRLIKIIISLWTNDFPLWIKILIEGKQIIFLIEYPPFSIEGNPFILELIRIGQPRIDKMKHLKRPLARSCWYQSVRENIKIFHTVQGLWSFSYFHIFLPRLSLWMMKTRMRQVHWLDQAGIYSSIYSQQFKRFGHFR